MKVQCTRNQIPRERCNSILGVFNQIPILPPRDSSPGGDAFVIVSNSAARSTWHDVSSHDNRPEINIILEILLMPF